MKKIVFIGNRVNVLKECLKEPDWEIIKIFAVQGSTLIQYLRGLGEPCREFRFHDKSQIIEEIQNLDFDILVSNGCPFILPIKELSNNTRLFINTHPSLLPALKGPHPINGLFILKHEYFGATTHFMVDDVDSGGIISQVKGQLTSDLDLGMVYRLSFLLEADAFRRAINLLKNTNYLFGGFEQEGEHSFYRRKAHDLVVDSAKETDDEILNKVKAFGISTLGVHIRLANGEFIRTLEAYPVFNNLVYEKFQSSCPGTITLEYEDFLLIQCASGLLRVRKVS